MVAAAGSSEQGPLIMDTPYIPIFMSGIIKLVNKYWRWFYNVRQPNSALLYCFPEAARDLFKFTALPRDYARPLKPGRDPLFGKRCFNIFWRPNKQI